MHEIDNLEKENFMIKQELDQLKQEFLNEQLRKEESEGALKNEIKYLVDKLLKAKGN